jgi:rod shape-determining protein MreD
MERLGGTSGGRVFANMIPVVSGLIGVMITNLPISLFGGWVLSPMYALMPIYYWCLVRPDLMTPVWAFLIGLAHDLLSGGPIGLWAAAYVATYAVIDWQRDGFAGLSGWGAILGFATATLVACTMHYVITSFYNWQVMAVGDSVQVFAVTAILYAVVLPLLGWLHRKLVGPMRSEF